MLRQIEGSRAVAETVALCRPEVDLRLPDLAADPHRRGSRQLVKSGELAPCEFINVESEFAAMSVAIGASATGARAYTATASQGLLFMTEALYNASGLGPADRDDGRQPRDRRADQHLERPQRRDGPARLRLDPALRRDQPGGASTCTSRPSASPRSSRRPVMVCMDGFILTHAVEGVDVPDQEQVDAFLPPFEPRQVLDPDEPVSIGAMVGPEAFTEVRYLAHAKQLQALELIPEIAAEFDGGVRARLRRAGPRATAAEDAETVVVALGSVLGTIKDAVDELRERGRQDRRRRHHVVPAVPARGACARRSAHAERVVVLEKALAVGIGGIVSAERRAWRSPGIQLHGSHGDRRARRPADHARRRCAALFADAVADRLEPLTLPRPGLGASSSASSQRMRASRTLGPARREHPARPRRRRRGSGMRACEHERAGDPLLPDGQLRGRQPPARPRAALGAGRRGAHELDHLRAPRLPGLRRGARRALRARRGDARDRTAS